MRATKIMYVLMDYVKEKVNHAVTKYFFFVCTKGINKVWCELIIALHRCVLSSCARYIVRCSPATQHTSLY